MSLEISDDATDEQIREAACSTHGCTNYRVSGYIVCLRCLHGADTKIPLKAAKRKLQMEREGLTADRPVTGDSGIPSRSAGRVA